MDWELDDLIVAEIKYVSHNLSDPMQFDLGSRAFLELCHDNFCSLNKLTSIQLFVNKSSKIFIGQGFSSLLVDLFSHELWLRPHFSNDV